MANKRYSNRGVNASLREQAQMAADRKNRKQTLIVVVIALVAVVALVIAAILLGTGKTSADGDTTTTAATTTTSGETTKAPEPNADMSAIKQEIDSMRVLDFEETSDVTEYVKISIKNYGDVVVRLRSDIAPKTVENFQSLVSKKFYDGLTFHRIARGFMIQGGDPDGTGNGGSETKIKGEFSSNGVQNDLSHVAGVISMARRPDSNDSATSQFFICNADASGSLDGKYAAFGYVVAGMEVVLTVSEIEVTTAAGSTEQSKPVMPVVMDKICFVTPVKDAE